MLHLFCVSKENKKRKHRVPPLSGLARGVCVEPGVVPGLAGPRARAVKPNTSGNGGRGCVRELEGALGGSRRRLGGGGSGAEPATTAADATTAHSGRLHLCVDVVSDPLDRVFLHPPVRYMRPPHAHDTRNTLREVPD